MGQCQAVDSAETHNSYKVETLISNYCDIKKNLYQNNHVIKVAKITQTDNLSSNKTYSILISNIVNKPTSNILFRKIV